MDFGLVIFAVWFCEKKKQFFTKKTKKKNETERFERELEISSKFIHLLLRFLTLPFELLGR